MEIYRANLYRLQCTLYIVTLCLCRKILSTLTQYIKQSLYLILKRLPVYDNNLNTNLYSALQQLIYKINILQLLVLSFNGVASFATGISLAVTPNATWGSCRTNSSVLGLLTVGNKLSAGFPIRTQLHSSEK